MQNQSSSAPFGLHFLQKPSHTFEVTGAYDPEQELWIHQGQPLAGGITNQITNRFTENATGTLNFTAGTFNSDTSPDTDSSPGSEFDNLTDFNPF